jgi:DNA-binding transcriptional MerR regulator
MGNASLKTTPNYRLLISDATELKLLEVPEELRAKLAEAWSLPQAGIKNNGATYRFINYLTSTGLLDDRRETTGKGWRKFSYSECIYLNIVVALRKFGVKIEAIKPVYKLFSQQYDNPKRARCLDLRWLDLLITVHAGIEMELIIQEDGQVLVCDPQMMSIFGTDATKGCLRVSLSTMVNQLRVASGKEPIEIKRSFGDLPLNNAEIDAVIGMRDLKQGQDMLHIKRTANGTLIEKDKIEEASDELTKRVNALIAEDFSSVRADKRQGKVVNVKKTTQTLYND